MARSVGKGKAEGHERELPPNRLASVHAMGAKTVRRDPMAPPDVMRDKG
jgi:hypothetical protein